MADGLFIHPSADVSPEASIGENTKIWHDCQVREHAVIGQGCILGKGVYIDSRVRIGNNVKIQNGVSLYEGVTLEDGAFCGPHCVFTNDPRPRAVNPDGHPRRSRDWTITKTLVHTGASIGAGATVLCGVVIGRWAMVGAGSVVTRDVPDHGLVYGNPARLLGFVCPCGETLVEEPANPGGFHDGSMVCLQCAARIAIPGDARALWAANGQGRGEPGDSTRAAGGPDLGVR